MKKTVLFLINGFGIEKKDSYSIYDANALPTLDKMMNNNLYTSIESSASDYTTGYQLFSTGTLKTNNYAYLNDLIENNKLIDNESFKKFNNDNIGKVSRIHFFVHLNSEDVIETLNKFVKYLKLDMNRVIVHFILNQSNLAEYKSITTLINNFTFSSFKATNIGLIFGESIITDSNNLEEQKNLARILFNSKSGEKWPEYAKKLNGLSNNNILPINIPPFCINDDFTVKDNDTFIFFNFSKCNYKSLIDGIMSPPIVYKTVDTTTLQLYSLFPIDNETRVTNLLDNIRASEYMADYLDKTNVNTAILTDQENLNIINYMVNGFANLLPPKIKYLLSNKELLANKEQMQKLIFDSGYDLIIINTRIDNLKTINEIKDMLHTIDSYVAILEELCQEKATLIISSLFGINKELQISSLSPEKGLVNFYGSVPCIVVNSTYSKEEYALGFGTVINILGTALKCCNEKSKYPTLIKQKNALFKSLKEKLEQLKK